MVEEFIPDTSLGKPIMGKFFLVIYISDRACTSDKENCPQWACPNFCPVWALAPYNFRMQYLNKAWLLASESPRNC